VPPEGYKWIIDRSSADVALKGFMRQTPSFRLAMRLRELADDMNAQKQDSTDRVALEKQRENYQNASESVARFSEYDRCECIRQGLDWEKRKLGDNEYSSLAKREDIERTVNAYRDWSGRAPRVDSFGARGDFGAPGVDRAHSFGAPRGHSFGAPRIDNGHSFGAPSVAHHSFGASHSFGAPGDFGAPSVDHHSFGAPRVDRGHTAPVASSAPAAEWLLPQ
jgi:hypothetical protein